MSHSNFAKRVLKKEYKEVSHAFPMSLDKPSDQNLEAKANQFREK